MTGLQTMTSSISTTKRDLLTYNNQQESHQVVLHTQSLHLDSGICHSGHSIVVVPKIHNRQKCTIRLV